MGLVHSAGGCGRARRRSLPQPPVRGSNVDMALRTAIYERSGEAESRAAKALGVDLSDLAIISGYLWGQSLSDERDKRSGMSATAQKRGRITRELYGELRTAIDGDD